MQKDQETILALDPGTKEMGVAVLHGPELVDYCVKTFRQHNTPRKLLVAARRVMISLLDETEPDVVAIETAYFAKTKRSALLSFLTDELQEQTSERSIALQQFQPRAIRSALLGQPKATKRQVAEFIIKQYPDLRRHWHPGDFWREKYWSHVFDATALALAAHRSN